MEIDPVVLQLRADVQKYRAEILSTTNMVDASLGRQERAVLDLERQIKASSGQIGGHLRGMAGAFASYLSVRQIAAVIDSFTRFQNSLRVAGLEGEKLADVQQRLRQIGATYGVGLESLGDLFSRASMAQKALGASTEEIIQLNTIVSAGLKITGSSAAQASGALLQLGQALGAGVVRAEEFNSIIEGAYPVAQAAARGIAGFAGDVAKLRIAIAKGEITSKQFFEGVLRGGVDTVKQAESATLTLSGAMTKLANEFTIYIGEGAKANGVTAALSSAIGLAADNIDTLADAIAVLSTLLVGRFVGGMVAAGIAARAAGVSMMAAFGGPIGLAVSALTLVLGYMGVKALEAANHLDSLRKSVDDAEAKADAMEARLRDAGVSVAGLGGKSKTAASGVDILSRAMVQATGHATDLINELQRLGITKIAGRLSEIKAERDQIAGSRVSRPNGGTVYRPGAGRKVSRPGDTNQERLDLLDKEQAQLQRQLSLIMQAQKAGVSLEDAPGAGTPPTKKPEKPKKIPKAKAATGPTAAEIEREHQAELQRIYADRLQDELAITTDVQRRREIMAELDRIEYEQRKTQVENDKNFTKEQKAAQIAALQERFGTGQLPDGSILVKRTPLTTARERQERDDLARIQSQELRDAQDTLAAQADLVDDRRARAAIEARILELRQEEERLMLETAIANGQIADAAKARANLETRQAAERTGLSRDFESPLASYARGLNRTDGQISDQVEALVVAKLQSVEDGITDALSKAIGTKDPLISGLIRLLVQEVLMKPMAKALSEVGAAGGGSGILGAIGSVLGSVFGRASGGYVGPGQTVRVNENKGGVELLRMGPKGGKVIPLGQTNAARHASTAQKVFNISVSADNAVTPAGFAQGLARQILAEAARMDAATSVQTRRQSIGDQAYFNTNGTLR